MFLNYRDSYLAISWQKYATIETDQLNHDRPDLRQPGMGVSHQPSVLLLS